MGGAVGKADGIEVGTADQAAWDEAVSRLPKGGAAPVKRAPNPLAALSLHACRLLPADEKNRDPSA